jgi:hypothetical protein
MEIGWGLTLPLDDPQFWSIVFTLIMVVVARVVMGMEPVQVDIEKIAPPPSFIKGAEGRKDRKKKEDSAVPVPAQGSSNTSAPAPGPASGPVKSFSKKAIEADDRFVRYLKGHQDVITAIGTTMHAHYLSTAIHSSHPLSV